MDGFTPQTIVDQPIPLLEGGYSTPSGNNSNPVTVNADVAVPTTNIDKTFPVAIVAVDTISQSINTETKTILGTYTFESLGAIAIGTYVNGVSGEIDVSPNGITAKNVNGTTTFALDGTTGNATFLGTINVGSLIAGAVNVGNANVQIDGANARIMINDGTNDRVLIGYQSGGF